MAKSLDHGRIEGITFFLQNGGRTDMRWWKKDSDDADRLEMRELRDEWGWQGYGWFDAIRGKIANRVTETNVTFALQLEDGRPYPIKLLARDIAIRPQTLEKICYYLAEHGLIDKEARAISQLIAVPQMRSKADEYTRKPLAKSGQDPDQE